MSTQPKTHLTPEEYFELDSRAEVRSEYYRGEMYSMAGARANHNRIQWNVAGEFRQQIRSRSCEGFASEMRVKVSDDMYAYPGVVVVCGGARFLNQQETTLLNPTVIVEILSPSTEAYDRGLKFELYSAIESLQEYVLIASDRVHVDRYTRQASGQWLRTSAGKPDETIHVESIDVDLRLADLYENVQIAERPVIPTRLEP